MQWFTLSPRALRDLQETTTRLRQRLGHTQVGERVKAMSEDELFAFVNDVLKLVDENETILKRTRPEAPAKEKLPTPFAALRG